MRSRARWGRPGHAGAATTAASIFSAITTTAPTGTWQTDAEFIANDRATCELPGGSATGSYWLYLSHGRGWRPPPTGGKEGGGVMFTM